ncbi:30S ribosomal protein S5 [Nanoarchaeota archaeon]
MPKEKEVKKEEKVEVKEENKAEEKAPEKEVVKPLDDTKVERRAPTEIESWKPSTELGKKVKSGEISDINQVFESGLMIKEAQIVDLLIPDLETDLLLIGQSKGKFGGGQRRVFKQTQKKTMEGNKPKFATYAVVGNGNGFVGTGYGKSKETVPAREKAIRNAKVGLIKLRRGCGSWQCGCKEPHTIPFAVEGKCGSVQIKLMPAPKGAGLRVEKECQKILKLAGVKDIWSKTQGQTSSRINVVKALMSALNKLMHTKIQHSHIEEMGITDGATNE